jgi:hypothetical protein
MKSASEKMVCKRFLVSPSTARRLERLSEARGTSAAEIVRQAINACDGNSAEAMGSNELMAGWKDRLLDVLNLTDEVKRLTGATEKLAERTIDIDKRLVRLEAMVEVRRQRRLLSE